SGVGDCCAPKLLAHAQKLGIIPVALVEAWWQPGSTRSPGSPLGLRPACAPRGIPILGFMLCGVPHADTPPAPAPPLRACSAREVESLYHQQGVLLVNKPSGLPSVPGRSGAGVSFVELLRETYPGIYPPHRLDMDTS